MSSAEPPVGVSPATGVPHLLVDDLRKQFTVLGGTRRRRSVIRAVDGVSFQVERGETLGVVGESGSGKSTLGRTILQLHRPSSGSVTFEGVALEKVRPRVLRQIRPQMQMVFQDPRSSLDPRMKVFDIVAEPLRLRAKLGRTAYRERVVELLEMVGFDPASAGRHPHEFSGGQQQRVGIARALACEPSLLVCDEPVSALDVSIQAQIVNLLRELQSTLKLTYLFISHDLAVVRYVADRVAVMYLGRIVEIGPSDALYHQPRHPYTWALLSAVPVPDPPTERNRRRIILSNDLPSPADTHDGCPFRSRCWLYQELDRPEQCLTAPPTASVAPSHDAACHFTNELAKRRVPMAVAAPV
jgi:oligopeptide/dipeptide ABC transporter ATP-binding protein